MEQERNITNAFEPEDIEKNKVMAGLGYIIFFLPLIVMKDSKFARFHANQILLLLIPAVIVSFLGTFASIILISGLHFGAASFVSFLIFILEVVIGVIAIINMVAAFQGKAKRVPIVGKMSIIKNSNNMDAEDMFQNETLNRMTENFQNFSFSTPFVTCTNCGNKILKGKKFCSKCGTPAPEIKEEKPVNGKKCVHCGSMIEKNMKFCPQCGQPVPEEKMPEKKVCVKCGKELEENQKFCPECGTPVVIKKKIEYCPKCNTKLKDNMKFCPECGEKITEE